MHDFSRDIEKYLLVKYPPDPSCRYNTAINKQKREVKFTKMMQTTAGLIYDIEQTDCRECSGCKDMILTDMYRLTAEVMGAKIPTETVYCKSCYLMALITA